MSYNSNMFRKTFPDPRAQVWPCTQTAVFYAPTLAAGGSQPIQVTQIPLAVHYDWLLGAFNVLSFAVIKDQVSGAIRVDIDPGGGTFYQAFVFPLTGENVVDTLTGFEIGGLAARFTFVNGLVGITNATGWIQLRSW